VPRNSSWVTSCLRPFQHASGTDSPAGWVGDVSLGACFYSFDTLDTTDAHGNTADAGWGWLPDHVIDATKLWLADKRAAAQALGQIRQETDDEQADQNKKRQAQARKRKQQAAATAANRQVISKHLFNASMSQPP